MALDASWIAEPVLSWRLLPRMKTCEAACAIVNEAGQREPNCLLLGNNMYIYSAAPILRNCRYEKDVVQARQTGRKLAWAMKSLYDSSNSFPS